MARSLVLSALMVLGAIGTFGAQDTWAGNNMPRKVVLDPGHGGRDTGVIGADGTMEKDVNLALARLVAVRLDGRGYQAFLVRTGDYYLDIISRSAKANRAGADLFLSFHVGGGFSYKEDGGGVFYVGGDMKSDDGAVMPVKGPAFSEYSLHPAWETVNRRYGRSNRLIATEVQQVLSDLENTGDVSYRRATRLGEARLAVLEGADMPAAFIELGCLTNPTEEKRLRDPDFLSATANRICDAIGRFFQKQAGN